MKNFYFIGYILILRSIFLCLYLVKEDSDTILLNLSVINFDHFSIPLFILDSVAACA